MLVAPGPPVFIPVESVCGSDSLTPTGSELASIAAGQSESKLLPTAMSVAQAIPDQVSSVTFQGTVQEGPGRRVL